MRAQAWKVPPLLAVVVVTWACGRNAESATDDASERVIPAAGEPTPPPVAESPTGAAAALPETPEADPAPRAAPSTKTRPPVADRDEPVSTPPVAVVRTDPEPSVAPAEPTRVRPGPLVVPQGTRIPLTVQDELSTRVSHTGDTFDAVVDEDILGGSGMVLLARGTRVRGRVVESTESPGPEQPATLALAVERVELSDRLVPISATVVELEHETEARDSDARTAAKVGAGVVAGAILGKIIGGDGKDVLKGAVAGAAAGAAVAHATRDGHAKVPLGARMVIVLDQPLPVEGASAGGR